MVVIGFDAGGDAAVVRANEAADQFSPDRLVRENLEQAQAVQLRFKRRS